MGGVINSTKKAFTDTTGQAKLLFTHPSSLNAGQFANVLSAGGASVPEQAFHTATDKAKSTALPDYTMDPSQSANDMAQINALGQQEYNQTLQQVPADVGNAVNQELPGIEETLNSQHLLNSTELPHQIAQQQEYLTQNLAVPAMQNLQSFQTGALQRGMSLEDFNNQAAVAKSLGSTVAPVVGNGKGGAVAGLGAGASAGTAIMPGWGTAIGGALGAASGYVAGGGLNGGSTSSGKGGR